VTVKIELSSDQQALKLINYFINTCIAYIYKILIKERRCTIFRSLALPFSS
jgi:hypothetical protein